jgi:hypothetical protein
VQQGRARGQTENRGAGGEAGQAGVPPSSSNGMGVAMCCPVRERWAPPCGGETARFAVGSYSGFAVAGKEKAARVPTGGKFAVTPPMPLRDDRRPAARYQIADVVARMVAGRRPTIGAIKSDRAKEKPPTARGKSPAAPCFAQHIVSATAITS